MRRSWRLQGLSETCIIAPRSLVSQEEQAAYLSAQLDRWLADPAGAEERCWRSTRTSVGILPCLQGGCGAGVASSYVKSEILQAFRRGEFVLMRLPHLTIFPNLSN